MLEQTHVATATRPLTLSVARAGTGSRTAAEQKKSILSTCECRFVYDYFTKRSFRSFSFHSAVSRIVTRLVFIDNSDSLYTARKLDQLYHIYANLMECLDMLNSSSTIQTYTTMMFTAVFILLGVYAKIR